MIKFIIEGYSLWGDAAVDSLTYIIFVINPFQLCIVACEPARGELNILYKGGMNKVEEQGRQNP